MEYFRDKKLSGVFVQDLRAPLQTVCFALNDRGIFLYSLITLFGFWLVIKGC
jgi:hypothetical protein